MIQVAVVGARGIGVSHVAALRQLPTLCYHHGPRTLDMQAWNWKALDVVTHRYRLAEIDNAYADMRAKPEGFLEAVIVP